MLKVRGISALALVLLACAAGCGGGGSGGSSSTTPSASNVASVVVDSGPAGAVGDVNLLFVTVTVCTPGSTTACQSIDHVQVDTQSYGLRIISTALSSKVALPPETDANNNPLAECAQFADGYSWGSVRTVDLKIASELAANIPVHLIGDATLPNVPSDCSSTGTQEDTVATFGANGILGIGVFNQDCGTCTTGTQSGHYYVCPTPTTCQDATVIVAQEVSNPVYQFVTDNNGIIIQLPGVSSSNSSKVTGSLVFGIDTQTNNTINTAVVLGANPSTGAIGAIYKNKAYSNSFFDTGSNAYFFADSTILTCSDNPFMCPSATANLSVTAEDINAVTTALSFSIANADTLFKGSPNAYAFDNLGAQNSDKTSFVWGIPFFYGHNVYIAFAGRGTSAGGGPFYAF